MLLRFASSCWSFTKRFKLHVIFICKVFLSFPEQFGVSFMRGPMTFIINFVITPSFYPFSIDNLWDIWIRIFHQQSIISLRLPRPIFYIRCSFNMPAMRTKPIFRSSINDRAKWTGIYTIIVPVDKINQVA